MKFNWGTGIAIFYTLFVLAMVSAVIVSTQLNHDLVVNDYYAKDIAFQSHYDKMANGHALKKDVLISYNGQAKTVDLRFPDSLGTVSGKAYFYRPSNAKLDFSLDISTDSLNTFSVPANELLSGAWTVKADWQAGGKPYYKETSIDIP
jgi:hypothetical protein